VAEGDDNLFAFGPGVPRMKVPGSDAVRSPRFAGAAIAGFGAARFVASEPVVLDPGATTARPIGLPSLSLASLDADAAGVAWLAHGCVLYAPVGATAPAEPPAGPCPRAETEVQGASTTMRGRTVRLEATCVAATASGCTGTATIVRANGRTLGRGSFHADAGHQRHFSVRLSRRGARFVRREVRREGDVLLRITTRTIDGGPPNDDGITFIQKVR
jgi:hypothetical protein